MNNDAKVLLRKVEQHILAEPPRLRMDSWALTQEYHHASNDPNTLHISGHIGGYTSYGEPEMITYPVCGIVGCIAGWMVIIARDFPSPEKLEDIDFETAAERLLGEHHVPFNLFYVDYWPQPFRDSYKQTNRTHEERAKIVCEVIETYIKASEREETIGEVYESNDYWDDED